MKKQLGALLVTAGLALFTATNALAKDYLVQNGLYLWSEFSEKPTAGDTIAINTGGTLYVDVDNAVVGKITIGDASTAGSLLFDSVAPHTLTVSASNNQSGDVVFGANSNNKLDLSGGTKAHTLNVAGSFLASGSGTFTVGLGTVVYNRNGDQTVTAKIGAATINYRNLTLAGSGKKTLDTGVTVQGKLIVAGTATVGGTVPVIYGALGSLEYAGTADNQTTTGIEWPSPLSVAVTINNAAGKMVSLDSNKTLGGKLTITGTGKLDNNGKNLTLLGAVENQGTQQGAGQVILGGSTAQTIVGAGHFGNLTVNNAAGVTADSTGFNVDGRLIVAAGKLTLPSGLTGSARLLSLGTADQLTPGTYGSGTSGATAVKDDTYFGGSGVVALITPKPTPTFDLPAGPTITYGTASVTLTGRVKGGDNGNFAVDGELVTIRIETGGFPITMNTVTTGGNGSFSATFNTSTLPANNYPVSYYYSGGINLAAASQVGVPNGLVVNKLTINVTPQNVTKVYGTSDPALVYTYTPALVPGDGFSGALTRSLAGAFPDGEQAGSYAISKGTLSLPANYDLVVVPGRTLTITKMTVNVTANNKSKTYGDADPALDYTFSPPTLPFANDHFTGGLTRDAGENVGQYNITKGDLAIGPGNNYNINYTGAKLTINKKSVSVSVATDNLKKVYGFDDPTMTPIATPALPLGDVFDGKLHRADGETVASYPVDKGTLTIKNGDANKEGNYNLTLQTMSFTITKKPVVISAVTAPSRHYGADMPALVKYDGLWKGNKKVPDQDTTTTPATVKWTGTTPVVTTLPGNYAYTVNSDARDDNYSITYQNVASSLTIDKAPLTITADNKTKVYDGGIFDPGSYTASYNFVAGDTVGTAFTGGSLAFTGDAMQATEVGVYTIDPSASTYTSAKYDISYATGLLVINTGVSTTTLAGDQTWGPGGSLSWKIDQANGGTAGSSPGWSLVKITKNEPQTGTLTITATPGNPFTIYATTLIKGTASAGSAAKFDPTRPYAWSIVRTDGGIVNPDAFDPTAFTVKSDGVGLFANPTFGGTFGVALASDNKGLNLTFTPKAQTDVKRDDVLAAVRSSDVDVLYLEANKSSMTPQETVTISLKVANLQQPVFGAQAFLRFSSADFIANTDTSKPGVPVIVAGGGVWDNVITKMWNTGGDLDTVIGLSFSAPLGTSADGTVALITLTPTKTATDKTRVIFRGDNEVMEGGITGGTQLSGQNGSVILPARVPSGDIQIVKDDKGPVIDSLAATQVQYGTVQNVLNGPSNAGETYSTNTVRGTVNITVAVHDLPGVGLKQQPTVTLSGPGPNADAKCTNPGTSDGIFSYEWKVDGGTANGTWTATVNAVDNKGQAATAKTFKLGVNKNQVTGIVELSNFAGSSRTVNFKAGDGSAIKKSWDLPLNFTTTTFQAAGAFRDLPALAQELLVPKTAVTMSTYLRYGTISDLPSLVSRLLYGTDGVAMYLRDILFGYVDDVDSLNTIATQLKSPARAIDAYIKGRLSASTLTALNNYVIDPAHGLPNATMIANLETGLLNDWNEIALGASIYDPLRFQSVQPPVTTDPRIPAAWFPPYGEGHPAPTGDDLIQFNRYLLSDAYLGYVIGALHAQTAHGLVAYTGGVDDTLTGYLLIDLDTLTQPGSAPLWVDPGHPNVGLYSEVRFLNIALRTDTANLVLANPPVDSTDMVKLNRMLLEDGLATSPGAFTYQSGPISPATGFALANFVAAPNPANQAIVDPLLMGDLNKLLAAGTVTRSALESAYPTQITKYKTLATYTLINVPDGTTLVSAKTAWNVRQTLPVAVAPDGVANFVNGENVAPVNDNYLKPGDVTGDNTVNLSDYSVLQQTYLSTTDLRADVNGDGAVNILDYTFIKNNFSVKGDNGVDGKP